MSVTCQFLWYVFFVGWVKLLYTDVPSRKQELCTFWILPWTVAIAYFRGMLVDCLAVFLNWLDGKRNSTARMPSMCISESMRIGRIQAGLHVKNFRCAIRCASLVYGNRELLLEGAAIFLL